MLGNIVFLRKFDSLLLDPSLAACPYNATTTLRGPLKQNQKRKTSK